MTDINHEKPMYCEISPPNNGPKKYAKLTLAMDDGKKLNEKNEFNLK